MKEGGIIFWAHKILRHIYTLDVYSAKNETELLTFAVHFSAMSVSLNRQLGSPGTQGNPQRPAMYSWLLPLSRKNSHSVNSMKELIFVLKSCCVTSTPD